MGQLTGKYAVVTGAGRGIGACIVKKFLAEGATKVALLDINEIDTTELDPTGERAFAYVCNVGDYDNVKAVFEKIYEDFGRIDVLVNNAGITRDAIFHKMTVEQWHQVLNINLNSVFYTCRCVVERMRAQNSGRIINISSTSILGNPGQANYAAAKSGMIGFTKTIAKELGRKTITVNCVAPGATNTEMYMNVPQEIRDAVAKNKPFGRLGEPMEVANTVSFLASDDASYVSGQVISVTGGS
ncbi:MAG: SDR family oxidoreductase [Ruminococcaceae bacterium]|nr:SDR family oxidoreductase [Oscillospiraceae bacterium]